MKVVFRKGMILLGSMLTSILILSFFALAYDNSGLKTKDAFGATGSKWQGRQYVSNMVEGFGWLFTDENGYNNETVKADIDVLVMGDSYMEAIQVMQWQNTASLLQKETDYNVYNISIAGRKFPNRVMSLEKALSHYTPSKYIILNLDRAQFDINSMEQAMEEGQQVYSTIQFSSGLMYYIKQIPCVKPFLYQLKQWIESNNTQESIYNESSISNSFEKEESYQNILHKFLMQIKTVSDKYNVHPVIVYHPDVRLHSDGNISFSSEGQDYVRMLQDECASCEIIYVDMTDDFNKLYNDSHILAYGFTNTAVGTGHINKYGHQMIAKKLVEVIMGDHRQ